MRHTPIDDLIAELDGLAAGVEIQYRKAVAEVEREKKSLGPLCEVLADVHRRDCLDAAIDKLDQAKKWLQEADI